MGSISGTPHGPHLGIPTLHGYLESKGFKNLEVIDYTNLINRGVIKKLFNSAQQFFEFTCFKKFVFVSTPMKQMPFNLSLNEMLDPNITNNPFYKNEVEKIRPCIESLIKNKNPDIIGISIIYPHQIFYSLLISSIIKEIKKKTFIVFGGAQITKHIKYFIQRRELTELIEGFVVGDGEEPLAELLYQLDKDKNLSNVPNFYFKTTCPKTENYYTKSSFSYSYNPQTGLVIPDFSGFKIKKTLPVRASVGCYWAKCAFCTYKNFHKNYICSKPEDIIALIKELMKKYEVNDFYFTDDSLSIGFLRKFSELVLAKKLRISWQAFLCFQPGLLDEPFVKNLAGSGFKLAGFGLESVSPRILRLMNKPQKDNPEIIMEILKLFKKYNINTMLHMMFGFPSETKEEAEMTLKFLIDKKDLCDIIALQQFTLEDDTLILKHPSKFYISKVCKEDKNGFRLGFYYKTCKGMTLEESREFVDYAMRILKRGYEIKTQYCRFQ